jgi:hypothetical protein
VIHGILRRISEQHPPSARAPSLKRDSSIDAKPHVPGPHRAQARLRRVTAPDGDPPDRTLDGLTVGCNRPAEPDQPQADGRP